MKGRKIGCGTIVLVLLGLAILRAIFTPLFGTGNQVVSTSRIPENVSEERTVPERPISTTSDSVTAQDNAQQDVSESPTKPEPVEKPQKNGFDEATNEKLTFGHINYSIPSYFQFSESNSADARRTYYAEKGSSTAMLIIHHQQEADFREAFEADKDAFYNLYVSSLLETLGDNVHLEGSFDREFAGLAAKSMSWTATVNGTPYSGYGTLAYYVDTGTLSYVSLMQTDYSEYDYTGDYKKIIETATLNAVEKPVSQQPAEKPASIVSPDFKAAMDSYEAFFDEYVEFMKKYETMLDSDNPMAALTWLSEYTSWLNRYAETMDKLNDIDEDSLSVADYAYYIDVMARINKKLLEVAD